MTEAPADGSGSPPTAEDQLRQMREGLVELRSALSAGDDDGAFERLADRDQFEDLPIDDRRAFLEELRNVAGHGLPSENRDELMTELRRITLVVTPWALTSELWAVCGDWHREFPGDGPLLGDGNEEEAWQIRFGDAQLAERWQRVAKKLPDQSTQVLTALREEPKPQSRMGQMPLRGKLGTASVAGKRLDVWQIRRSGVIPRGRSTKRDTLRAKGHRVGNAMMLIPGEVRVLYAVQISNHIVWITDVFALERNPRSRKWRELKGYEH